MKGSAQRLSPARRGARRLVISMLIGCAALAAAPASGSAQDVAFTVIGGDLYRLDVTTGQQTLVGSTGFEITALAMSPSGELAAVEQGADRLLLLDPATAGATIVGPLGIDVVTYDADLSFDLQGQLWALAHQRLYRVDTTTGAATPALDTDLPGIGLAWAGPVLYTADDQLYIVDPATGDVQTLGASTDIRFTVNLCAYQPDVLLSLSVLILGPNYNFRLETVNTGTGDRQLLHELPETGGLALAAAQTDQGSPVPALSRHGVALLIIVMAVAGVLSLRRLVRVP